MARPKKILCHNPTNISAFNDITSDEEKYLKALIELHRSISIGERQVVGGNFSSLIALRNHDIRFKHLEDKLVTTMLRGSKADQLEAENILAAIGFARLHGLKL